MSESPVDGMATSDAGTPDAADTRDSASSDSAGAHRQVPNQRLVLAGLVGVVVVILAAGYAMVLSGDDGPPPPKPDIALDAWAPYWTLDDALPEFENRVTAIRDVSPFWFNATGVDSITIDPNALDEGIDEFIAIAAASDAKVVPSIIDAMPAGEMAAILADDSTRARHVAAIRRFAADGNYDGIDIDYEQFAFADGRASWATTRPNWVAFIDELGAALHDDGRTLTVSIPPVYDALQSADSGFWVYDYGAIAPHVDRIRIMAYDFSVDEPGPIAPLAFVERAILGAIEATGDPDKLVLGLPSYGRNWPTGTSGTCPATGVEGRTAVTARSVDDLIVRRSATPIPVVATGEWMFTYDLEVNDGTTSCVQARQVNYVDGDGIRMRMDLARTHQLNGVSLWALGFDDDAVWAAILPTVADAAVQATDPS